MTTHDEDPNRAKVLAACGHLGMLEVAVPCMRHRHEHGADITRDLERIERVLVEMRADLGLSPLLTSAGR